MLGRTHRTMPLGEMELGRIKLEIPDPLDDLFPSKRGRLIIERFHEILDKYGFDFELPTPIVVRDSGCEQLVVVVYERKDGMKRVRWRTICRGRTANDVPHDLAIADSPIFAVEFESLQLVTLYEILSRFRMRSGVGIEFASYPAVREEDVSYDRSKYKDRPEWVKDIVKERKFSLTYLIECLISRGAVVKDQLLLDVATWRDFLTVVSCCYLRNRELPNTTILFTISSKMNVVIPLHRAALMQPHQHVVASGCHRVDTIASSAARVRLPIPASQPQCA
ncbi:hypothetical protein NECAME_11507 [Necator americanus]|uniref:PH-like domain-containing protein n=1 Tax=Necator americanus TaxID=51031 RepID=W2T3R5_NECAM|nr:hypothetical protein NECAME_11507 [Necator americanus]ETN76655.1 hypothetical protein NECAME_11507 [Necator americanus]